METIQFEGKPYKISYEAMPEALKLKLSDEELSTYLTLLQKVQKAPRTVYKEVKAFGEKYAAIPEVSNLLTFAHIQNRRIHLAEQLIEKTFQDHPDYLFARINYADQCVRKKKLKKVEELFHTLDLQELCPEKETFHTSEFRGFLIMLAYYFLAKKEKEKAVHYYKGAKEVEPHHPSVVYLERKLFQKSWKERLFLPFRKKNG